MRNISLILLFIVVAIWINLKPSKASAQSEYFDVMLYDNKTGEYQITVSIDLNLYPKEEYIYVLETACPNCQDNIGFIKKQSSYRAGGEYHLGNMTYKQYFKRYPNGTVTSIVRSNMNIEGNIRYEYLKFSEDIYITETANSWVSGDQFARANLDITKWENGKTLDTKTMSIVGEDTEYEFKKIDIPSSWIGLGKYQYPNYIVVKKDEYFYFVTSAYKFYSDITFGDIHISEDTIISKGYVDNDKINWISEYEYIASYTKLLNGITSDEIIYNSHDILDTDVYPNNISKANVSKNTNNNIVIPVNPIPGITSNPKEYVYDKSIPTVNLLNVKAKKIAFTESGTDYDIIWQHQPEEYQLEIKAIYGNFVTTIEGGRWEKEVWAQSAFKQEPWFEKLVGKRVYDKTGSFRHNIIDVKKIIAEEENLQSDASLSLNTYYMRYVKVGSEELKHGNWKVIELYFDKSAIGLWQYRDYELEKNENVDSETGEITYTWDVVEGSISDIKATNDNSVVGGGKDYSSIEYATGEGLEGALSTIEKVGDWLGELPSLMGRIFSFLPYEIIALIGLGITLLIILRIVGR